MLKKPVIVWLRQDLRTADNPALSAAAATGRPILPVYILDDEAAGPWAIGGAQRWFVHQALTSLDLPMVYRRGDSVSNLETLIEATGAEAVYWNRRYAPFAIKQDKIIKSKLIDRGLEVKSFAASLLREPWEVEQQGGGPYKVYTPYSRMWLQHGDPRPPVARPIVENWSDADGLKLAELELKPRNPDWSGGLASTYEVGEVAAARWLDSFREAALFDYADGRNLPGRRGTSFLSAFLATGVISPHQIYSAVSASAHARDGSLEPARAFVRQLIWRDFAYANLYHFPHLPDISLRREFEGYPWTDSPSALRSWQTGQTGYPIVDAGMRQLWQTGYMHNRVRMIAGSFLTKDLLIHWRRGAEWFWDTLADADLANNSMGWQWVAGSGIDASPYFRIFNPTTQGEKFDPEGTFVRQYVPELAKLPAKWIHRPAEAPIEVLDKAGVRLAQNYPMPIVDHAKARQRALDGYNEIKSQR